MTSRRFVRPRTMIEALETRCLFDAVPLVTDPVTLQATALSSSAIRLQWNDSVIAEAGFVVLRSINASTGFDPIASVPANTVTWVDTNLLAGTTYFYRLELAKTDEFFVPNPDNDSPIDWVLDFNPLTATTSAATQTTTEDAFAQLVATDLDNSRGLLKVRGTGQDDVILLTLVSGQVRVNVNGEILDFDPNQINRIQVSGLGGNDRITIGPNVGSVTIYGGDGNDTLVGGTGNDRIDGGTGHDAMSGSAGDDTLTGASGNDLVYGLAGNDYLDGGSGNDKLVGGAGNDFILGGSGADSLYGNDGIDTLDGGSSTNLIVDL